jgi:hypothetical protein
VAVIVRDAAAEDWPAIWAFQSQIVAAGDTFAYDPRMTEVEARAWGEHSARRASGGRRKRATSACSSNAVAATNTRAIALYESLGFETIGTVPGAFRHPTEGYVGLCVMYRAL